MTHKLLVALILALPGLAAAQDPGNPPVEQPPDGTEAPSGTEGAPLNEAQGLRAELDQTELMLQEARDTLSDLESHAEAERAGAEEAQRQLEGARSDRALAETRASSAVDVAWYEVEQNREALKAAKQAKKLRKAERRLARKRGDREGIALASSELGQARQMVAARKADLAVARAEYRQLRAARERMLAQEQEAVAKARGERSAALDRVDVAVSVLDLARARVEMLEAKRDRIQAQIAHDEARRLLGEEDDLEDLAQALQTAREREDAAIVRLRELERAAGQEDETGSPTEPRSP